eukprot:jgi/Astpho2/6638/Aster-05001
MPHLAFSVYDRFEPHKRKCKGWDLLTDAEKDPDSDRITKEEFEEALAAAKAQKRKREEEAQAKPNAQAPAVVSEPSRIGLKDIEVSRGCDLLRGLSFGE